MSREIALIVIMIVGLVLRLWQLDTALWYDEAFSAWLAQLPLERLIEATLGDVHPPGYYLILAGVERLLGPDEIALRLPSLMAGWLLIPTVYALGGSLRLDERAVWTATVLTALAPFQIHYSTEARPYALLTLAVAGAGYFVISRRWWWAAGASLAALYLHNLAPLFIGGVWLAGVTFHLSRFNHRITSFSLDWEKYRENAYGLAGALVAIGLGYIPGFLTTLRQAAAVGGGYWIPSIDHPGRIIASMDDLLWFTMEREFVLATGLLTGLFLVLILADLVTPAALAIDRTITKLVSRSPATRVPGSSAPLLPGSSAFLALATALPLVGLIIASMVWQPLLISRSLAPLAPFYYLLLAVTITRTRRRWVTVTALAGPVLATILVMLLLGWSGRKPVDWELLNLVPADAALYHLGVGSYVGWKYYRPELRQYVWPSQTSLSQSLTVQTRRAMGMDQADFNLIKCAQFGDGQGGLHRPEWYLIYFNNPVTQPDEFTYINNLAERYEFQTIRTLRDDPTVEARLVKVNYQCPERS